MKLGIIEDSTGTVLKPRNLVDPADFINKMKIGCTEARILV